MATKTFEELKQMAIQIRDEKANKQNTATRIGTQMVEHLNKLEQEYYNKENIDEQNKQTDVKFSELDSKFDVYPKNSNGQEIIRCILGFELNNLPSNIGYRDYSINIFGIEPESKKFYIGVYDKVENARIGYFISEKTYSGIPIVVETIHGSFIDSLASYTCTFTLTINWIYYKESFFYNDNDVERLCFNTTPSLLKNNLRYLNNIARFNVSDYPFTRLIDFTGREVYNLDRNVSMSSSDTIQLPDNIVLNGNGHTIQFETGAKIITGENNKIINCLFDGKGVLESERVLREYPYYNYEPIINDFIQDLITNYYLDVRSFLDVKGNNTSVLGCIFKNINSSAIKTINGAGRIKTDNVLIDGCEFDYCYCGIYNKGEFNRLNANIFHGDLIGIYSEAGNYLCTSSFFKMNDVGFYSDNNGNGGHSQIVGTKFAHNERSLFVKELPQNLGLILSGSEVTDGGVDSVSCNSFMISGCRIDTWVNLNGKSNAAIGNIVGKWYAERDGKPIFSSGMNLKNNMPMEDGIESEINN